MVILYTVMSELKPPRAKPLRRMCIRRTADTLGLDSRIDTAGKIGIFHQSRGFTWIIIQPFPFSGYLHPAGIHLKHKPIRAFFDKGLLVDPGVNTEIQRLFQPIQTGIFR